MVRTSSLYTLKKIKNTHGPVFVKALNRIYYNFHGEWIQKLYFSTNDVAEITDVPAWYVRKLCDKLRIKGNIDYTALMTIIKAVRIKSTDKKMKFETLKQLIK